MKISNLMCSWCGSNFPMPRRSNRLRGKRHIKDIWCYKCKKVTKHIENYPHGKRIKRSWTKS